MTANMSAQEDAQPRTVPDDFNTIVGNAAKEYTEQGYSCFPLSLGDKRPLAKWKRFQTEIPIEDEIDEWVDQGAPIMDADTGEVKGRAAKFNLAIVTGAISGILVVDCDTEEAVAYAQQHGLSSPVAVKTRRGMHFYFRHPNNGRRYRNKAGSKPGGSWHNCPGLDFRGDGGYVVAPPSVSVHPDGTLKHEYQWSIQRGFDIDDLPTWMGPADDMEMSDSFDFATLSLEHVEIGDSAMDVREQIQKRVDFLGRKLSGPDQGDGTDDWMIRFAGQMVRRGMEGQALWDAIVNFHGDFFSFNGTRSALERWLKTKMRSALDMDRRNHPDDYNEKGERVKEIDPEPVIELKPLYSSEFQRLLDSLGDAEYHADPIVPSRSIIQVVGYNGHGKSIFVGNLATAMASGSYHFGPFHIPKPVKVFYLDFDNPARTVLKRFSGFAKVHGDPHQNLPIWSPAIIPAEAGGTMNLREPDGLKTLERWLDLLGPEVVVIDTVRNAFGAMDEKDPKDWYHVNRVAKIIRDRYKASVILVHHRNKPNAEGLGREAGSTAQLTDLDTQIIVTQVYNDKLIAKTKAGLFAEDLAFDRKGVSHTPYTYFQKLLTDGGMSSHRIKMVTEISFGKVREETDLHRTYYLGYTENIATGGHDMLWTKSPREDAMSMFSTGKYDEKMIAQELFIPTDVIKKWLNRP